MASWYYENNGQQNGPLDEGTIRSSIATGRIGPQTLVWREGMPNWQPLGQVPELVSPYAIGAYQDGFSTPVINYQVAPTSGLAVASLVSGIVGFVVCAGIGGLPAVICGHMALKAIDQSPVPLAGRGMAIAGLVMGYLQVALILLIGSLFFIGVMGPVLHAFR